MIFEGQHVMTSTWYPYIFYRLVNIYTCMRPFIVPNGRVYRYLLAMDPVLLRGNTTWNRPNISTDNWLIHKMYAFFAYLNSIYTHTCSLYFLFFDGRLQIKSTWYHCRLYKMVNVYTCRLPWLYQCRIYPYLLAVGPVISRGNTIISWPDTSVDHTSRLICTHIGVI